jgi:hypothetical protein
MTFFVLFALLFPVVCVSQTATTTQSFSVQISPLGKVSVPSSISLLTAGAAFSTFAGTLLVSQRIRTSVSGGTGAITLSASGEFTPTGGPTISGGALTYTCGGSTLGTACSGSQTVSTAVQTPVITVGANACTGGGGGCSSTDPNTVSINFTLTNSPVFKTGTFSVGLLFSVSAT